MNLLPLWRKDFFWEGTFEEDNGFTQENFECEDV